MKFRIGDIVVVDGLKSAIELNGLTGRVVELKPNKKKNRLGIFFETLQVTKSIAKKNLKKESKQKSFESKTDEIFSMHRGPASESGPSDWSIGLGEAEAAEWFIDCYRMRVDDDYCWGGGNFHGFYLVATGGCDEFGKLEVWADFMIFCKLAIRRNALPDNWSWELVAEKAASMLCYAFDKESAREKYGRENVFQAMFGGRSLRATAISIYGSGAESFAQEDEMHVEVTGEVEKAKYGMIRCMETDNYENIREYESVFEEVGGMGDNGVWDQFFKDFHLNPTAV